jgi:hypothetical protein
MAEGEECELCSSADLGEGDEEQIFNRPKWTLEGYSSVMNLRAMGLVSLFLLTGCGIPSAAPELAEQSKSQVSNLESCLLWQKAIIEALETSDKPFSHFAAHGIKLKNAASKADSDLSKALFIVAELFLGLTEKNYVPGWKESPEQQLANNYVIETCKSVGVFIG